MRGRAGVAYVSVSHPDGTFRGTYRDEDGVLRFKEMRRTDRGVVMRVFDLAGDDGVILREEVPSDYDPRTRGFYRLAVAEGRRAWTPPYTFFTSRQTGVTRTAPIYAPGPARALHAVLTVDFDVHALSSSMARTPLPGGKTLLFGRDGTILAYPEGAAALARLAPRTDRPLSHGDLGEPIVDALFARLREGALPPGAIGELSLQAPGARGGAPALAMVMPVAGFPELDWSVAAIVPTEAFFRARIAHERQSLLAAAVALVTALAIAVVFSRHVVGVRRAAAAARDLAREASEAARELGSYRLIERLGRGGMGEVWRAEHRLLVRQAAIKLIREEALAPRGRPGAALVERFRREAQTLGTLRSRHTIQIFDYGVTEDGTFFYVMELLDGMDLHTLVERHGPQPAGRVIALLLQACSSLAEAHDAGLVHRDVKPANLFVCRAADEVDVVKVLDFGLVQGRDAPGAEAPAGAPADPRITRAGQNTGTPAFMAPEQVRGLPTDGRADIYALGGVAVWLLTGRLPFEADTALGAMLAHVYTPLPPLGARVPGSFPPALEALLRRCLAKAPEDRPPDVRALAEALRAIALPAGEAWTPERARAWWSARERTEAAAPGAPSPRATAAATTRS
jgi:serine/threonine protein kinase